MMGESNPSSALKEKSVVKSDVGRRGHRSVTGMEHVPTLLDGNRPLEGQPKTIAFGALGGT